MSTYSGQSYLRQTPWTGGAEHFEIHLHRFDLMQMHPERFRGLQEAMQKISTCLRDPDGTELLEKKGEQAK